jgi:hypothetical protein
MFWDRKPVVKGTRFSQFPALRAPRLSNHFGPALHLALRAPRLSNHFGPALHLNISILPDDPHPSSTAGGKYGD